MCWFVTEDKKWKARSNNLAFHWQSNPNSNQQKGIHSISGKGYSRLTIISKKIIVSSFYSL